MVADMFGRVHFAANYGAADLAASVGSIVLAARVAGAVYDHAEHVDGKCYGNACFRVSFIVAAGCCGVALCSATALWLLIRRT